MVTFASQAPFYAVDQGLREVLGRVGLTGWGRRRGGCRRHRGAGRCPAGGCGRHRHLLLSPRVHRGHGGGLPHPVAALEGLERDGEM